MHTGGTFSTRMMPPILAPAQEGAGHLPVGRAGVLVTDDDDEEFDESATRPLPLALSISAGNVGAFTPALISLSPETSAPLD
jgi:hypothetical protein